MDGSILLTEVCPSCGEYVAILRDSTGWCNECSGSGPQDECERCGRPFENDSSRRFCSTCRKLIWLEQNIDEIEEFMVRGFSVKNAIIAVQSAHKTSCQSCGKTINVGHFCVDNIDCRRAYARYKNRRKKGLSEEQALREAIA